MLTKNFRVLSRCITIARNDKLDIFQLNNKRERGCSSILNKTFFYCQNRDYCIDAIKKLENKDENLSHLYNPGSLQLMEMTIGELFESAVEKWPNRECIFSIHQKLQLTYAEVYRRANILAAGLKKIGLKKGDRIGLWAPNDIEWFIGFIASMRLGLIMVGINPAYQEAEIQFCLEKVQVKAIIAPDVFRKKNFASIILECKEKCPFLEHIIIYSDNHVRGTRLLTDVINLATGKEIEAICKEQKSVSPYDGSNIQFTSGTTGKPKATFLTHKSLVNNSHQAAKRFQLYNNHHKICVNVPFFHAFGMIAQTSAWHSGTTLILPAPTFNPVSSVDAIVNEKCTGIYGTPTMWVHLIDVIKRVGTYLDHIKIGAVGGSPCSQELHRRIKDTFNFNGMNSIYGLTETTAIVFQSLPNEKEDLTETCVGYLSDHVEVKIVNENGSTVPFETPGELWVRGYNNMIEYWQDEESTKKVLTDDGWLKTGDQFLLRADGYGQIVGRLKDMIIRGGENIFPKEIEDFLGTHPDILENHVIGINDDVYGEEVCACIRLKEGSKLTANELRDWCKGKIAHFKIPKYLEFRDTFPCTTSGKIQKYLLKEEYEDKYSSKSK
ncbi:medium-chain acyl-CoA ligase ACSF2, mitochondrial [Leptopilina boulardi]|uniref:medium-chain acyl-CoA ligase ACSF2, mitochondrial n=1 Tax=Leptopilina boulardi TaxID=63433 RepID=UPI0021F54B97|nr:medium-chain acyl-CoA ligase ACSF2, mitochondrial [Leptopilina boulardi]